MDKALKKAFKSLPYILVRGKFLIPHPPKCPKFNMRFLKSNPFALIKRSFPHIIDKRILELAESDEKAEKAELFEIFMKHHQK